MGLNNAGPEEPKEIQEFIDIDFLLIKQISRWQNVFVQFG